MRSDDLGTSWATVWSGVGLKTPLELPISHPHPGFSILPGGIACLSQLVCVFAGSLLFGYPFVARTMNGGRTWTEVALSACVEDRCRQ